MLTDGMQWVVTGMLDEWRADADAERLAHGARSIRRRPRARALPLRLTGHALVTIGAAMAGGSGSADPCDPDEARPHAV